MDLGLSGKTALVVAASRGLGKASALALAQEGAQVAICSRTEAVEQAAAEIRAQSGSPVLAVRADVTRAEDIDALVKKAAGHFGQIDILVLNAGGPPPGTFPSLTAEDWQAAVQLTLMSAVRLCQAIVPHMIDRGGGSIVAIESLSVKQPIGNLLLSNSLRKSAS